MIDRARPRRARRVRSGDGLDAHALSLQPVVADQDEPSTVIDRWRADAKVLAAHGDPRAAAMLDRCAVEMERALSDQYTAMLHESDAMLRSGLSEREIKKLARTYRHTPHVRSDRHGTWLRACIVPPRPHLDMVRHALGSAGTP